MLAEALKLIISFQQIASHPQLVEPATVRSPFHMDEIDYHVARLIDSPSDRTSTRDVCVIPSVIVNVTHTHPFNNPFSGIARVSRYQKGKTSLDFTEARDNEWEWHQLDHMQVCTSLQTDNHASTPPLSVLQARFHNCKASNVLCMVVKREKKSFQVPYVCFSYFM